MLSMKIHFFAINIFLSATLSALIPQATFTPPKGWEVLSPSNTPEGITLLARSKPKALFASTINLAMEETSLSLEEYLEEVAKIHCGPSKHLSPLGLMQTSAGTMHIFQIDEKMAWADLRILQAILVKDSVAYVVTATTEESEFASVITPLLDSIKSFSILEGTKK